MKTHNGMRPQDVVVLLKILSTSQRNWQYRDLAADLSISVSEVSESLTRSHVAGLVDESRKRVHRQSLMEFVQHGLRYVFPAVPGTMVTGMPTAHSQQYFKARFDADLDYVWPDENGSSRGLALTPLHKGVPQAARKDETLYEWLAAIDILRAGRAREKKLALEVLKKGIL
jgi:predicted transcriptional regulator